MQSAWITSFLYIFLRPHTTGVSLACRRCSHTAQSNRPTDTWRATNVRRTLMFRVDWLPTLVTRQGNYVVIFFRHFLIHSPPPSPHFKTSFHFASLDLSRPRHLRFLPVILVLTCARGKRIATVPILTMPDRFRSHNCGRSRYAAPTDNQSTLLQWFSHNFRQSWLCCVWAKDSSFSAPLPSRCPQKLLWILVVVLCARDTVMRRHSPLLRQIYLW